MIDYKNIGSRLTSNEFNAIISLLRRNSVLYDEFSLENNNIGGKYGNYDISLNMASILDNGILISDNANNIGTIELKDKLFSNATYTLNLTVFYKESDNLGFNEEINEEKLNIVLEENTAIDIDFDTFEKQIIVGFNAFVIISFDEPIITGDLNKIIVRGKIEWDDYNNEYESRPEGVLVRLYAGGEEVDSLTVTADDEWRFKFTNLERYVNGHKIRYSITTDPTENYRTSIQNYVVTEEFMPPMTSATARVVWDDENNANLRRPASVALTLSNGEVFVANEENGWTVFRSGLIALNQTYSWEIHEVLGYTASKETNGTVTTFTLTLWTRPEDPENPKPPKTPGDDWPIFEDYETPL